MGFYIKYNDIRCLKNYTNSQFNTWQEEFSIVLKRLQAIVNLESYKGKTAESSKQYVNEVHTLLISSIIKAIADYQTKALLYSNGYYDNMDMDKDTIIVEEILDTVKNKFNTGRANLEFESNRLEAKIREISDLLYVPVPSTYSIFDDYANIDTRISELKTNITTYEQNKMNTDLVALENLIHVVKATIKGYLKKGFHEVTKYKTGDFINGETIAGLVTQLNISMEYSEQKKVEIATAIEKDNSIHMEIQAEIQAQREKEYDEYVKEMAKIRKNKGIVKIISSAAIMIAGGAAIVLTAGAATPVVFTMAGTAALSTTASVAITVVGTGTTIYGASEMYEGLEDYEYGRQGDIETISFNPVRDIAFAWNQTAYDVWGKLNLTFTMVAMPVYSAVNTAVTTPGAPIVKTVVKQLSKELAVDTMAGIAANETTKYIADRHDLSQSSQVLLNMGLNIFSQLGVRVGAGDFNIGKSSKDSSVAQTAEDIPYGKHWDDLEMGIHSNTPGMDAVDAARHQLALGKLDTSKGGVKTTKQLINESTCASDEHYNYLLKNVDSDAAKNFLNEGIWPEGVQIPKNSLVLNADGSINWSKAAEGGYKLNSDGTANKNKFVPKEGDVFDRYGNANGRYTSPIVDGKSYAYTERSLPYVEDLSNYHQYEVTGDFSKIEEYISKCSDANLKAKIEAMVIKYYDGDYRELVSYKGEIAKVDGWGTGGGIQSEFPITIDQLERLGLLKEIK